MSEPIPKQIADLVNARNRLQSPLSAEFIEDRIGQFLWRVDQTGRLRACVRLHRINWFSQEIQYLSVQPDEVRKGLGGELVNQAEDYARGNGARIMTCTIAADNGASQRLFAARGYHKVAEFTNRVTGRSVGYFIKNL